MSVLLAGGACRRVIRRDRVGLPYLSTAEVPGEPDTGEFGLLETDDGEGVYRLGLT